MEGSVGGGRGWEELGVYWRVLVGWSYGCSGSRVNGRRASGDVGSIGFF